MNTLMEMIVQDKKKSFIELKNLVVYKLFLFS